VEPADDFEAGVGADQIYTYSLGPGLPKDYLSIKPPPLLFHYTSAAGLQGIVQDRKLWATDLRFLNDSSELALALELLRTEFDRIPMPEPDGYEDGPDGPTPWWDGWVRNPVERYLREWEDHFRCYVTCFCATDDLLSQWRGYTAGQGYSIGFDPVGLRTVPPHGNSFEDVEGPVLAVARYDRVGVASILATWAERIAANRTGHPGTQGWHEVWWILPLLASVKHEAFLEENEWRVVQVEPAHFDVDTDPVRFRPSPYGLVPYRALSFADNAIRQVRIGPGAHADLRAKGVRDLLNRHALTDVEVLISTAPFRG
jgi:hypothetical protein